MIITHTVINNKIKDFVRDIQGIEFDIYDETEYLYNDDINKIMWMIWLHEDNASFDFLCDMDSSPQINQNFLFEFRCELLLHRGNLSDKMIDLFKDFYIKSIMKMMEEYYTDYVNGVWE